MIVLQVEDYCQNCPEFDPVVVDILEHGGFVKGEACRRIIAREILVECVSKDKCANIHRYINNELKKEKENA